MKFFGKTLIFVGFCLVFFGLILTYQRNNPNRVSFNDMQVSAKEVEKIPVRLVISKQNINLPVIENKIINKKWEVSSNGVNRIGNVYYGHNWSNLLGNLTKVKPNDIIEIQNSDNSIIKYKVEITQEVEPSQKDVLNLATKDKILIYTCSGFLDSRRFVIVANNR